jgi:hypothetical protein
VPVNVLIPRLRWSALTPQLAALSLASAVCPRCGERKRPGWALCPTCLDAITRDDYLALCAAPPTADVYGETLAAVLGIRLRWRRKVKR